MVWALAFAILLKLLGGGSPFLVPKLDKYVKKYVIEDTRKKEVLSIIKDAKKIRKTTAKHNRKHFKEISKLYKSRDAKIADFETILNEIIDTQNKFQQKNIEVTEKTQDLITADEWINIHRDAAKSISKSNKKRTKNSSKMEKHFLKMESKITKNITDSDKKKKALIAVENLKALYIKNHGLIQDELMNENSIMYQYKASGSELIALQEDFVNLVKEVYELSFKTHQDLVDLTTPEEWKKIMR